MSVSEGKFNAIERILKEEGYDKYNSTLSTDHYYLVYHEISPEDYEKIGKRLKLEPVKPKINAFGYIESKVDWDITRYSTTSFDLSQKHYDLYTYYYLRKIWIFKVPVNDLNTLGKENPDDREHLSGIVLKDDFKRLEDVIVDAIVQHNHHYPEIWYNNYPEIWCKDSLQITSYRILFNAFEKGEISEKSWNYVCQEIKKRYSYFEPKSLDYCFHMGFAYGLLSRFTRNGYDVNQDSFDKYFFHKRNSCILAQYFNDESIKMIATNLNNLMKKYGFLGKGNCSEIKPKKFTDIVLKGYCSRDTKDN